MRVGLCLLLASVLIVVELSIGVCDTINVGNPGGLGSYPDWPSVDSLTVGDYYIAGSDTAHVTVYISNLDPSHDFTIPVQLIVRNPPIDYEYMSAPQEILVPAGSQAAAEFMWADSTAVTFLEYDVGARLLYESGTLGNVVINGDFEGGLGGWTVINNNPPFWGVEHVTIADGDPDGEAHVYMTQYDTEGIEPEIYQSVNLPDPNSFIHLRFKCVTEDIIWGVGVALVYLKRGPGELIFWHSTAAAPPDTPTRHYIRVLDSQWNEVATTIDQIPGGSGDQLIIGSRATRQVTMPYAMVEVDTYLDDIGVCEFDPTVMDFYSAYIWTGMDTQSIGDYTAALQDCLTESFPDLGIAEAVVPLVSTVHMWDNFYGNMCAAAVYQDVPGKERQKNLAMFRSVYSLFEGPLDITSRVASTGKISAEDIIREGVIFGLKVTTRTYIDDQVWGDAEAWEESREALSEITVTAGEEYRDELLVKGAGELLISPVETGTLGVMGVSEPYVSADTLCMTGCWVARVRPDTLTWASVSDQPKVLLEQDPMAPSDPVRFTFIASDSGLVDFFIMHSGASGDVAISLDSLALHTGDITYVDAADTTRVFRFCVDYGGDGDVDTVYNVSGTAGVVHDLVGMDLPLDVYPNPARSGISIAFDVPGFDIAEVRLFDVKGTMVRTLGTRSPVTGSQTLTWDGRDGMGREVPPGIYFVRVVAGGRKAVKKVALLR